MNSNDIVRIARDLSESSGNPQRPACELTAVSCEGQDDTLLSSETLRAIYNTIGRLYPHETMCQRRRGGSYTRYCRRTRIQPLIPCCRRPLPEGWIVLTSEATEP
jgi:hypothetical protein